VLHIILHLLYHIYYRLSSLVQMPETGILPVQGDDYEAGRMIMERRKSVYFSFVCATRKEIILTLTLS